MSLGGTFSTTGAASGGCAGGIVVAGCAGSTRSGSGDGETNTTGGTTVIGGAPGDRGVGGTPGALTTGRTDGAAGTSGVPGMGGMAGRFTRNTSVANEPVVLDSTTGSIWQGCTAGATGDACDAGPLVGFVWQDAMDYCDALDWGGYQDWSLPSVTTLEGILDYGNTDPSIDTTAFPATPSGDFWSSSSSVSDPNSAWALDFNLGNTLMTRKCCVSLRVRCVRSGS
jgi:hypothetical protein